MKAKTKVLVTSGLSIALCTSLIAGSTYALFTDEAKVNVSITSGTVDVVATVDESSLTVWSIGSAAHQGNTFANGGTAVVTNGVLALNLLTPGDGVSFEVDILNQSTVAVYYKASVTATGDLAQYLEYGCDVTTWTKAEAGTANTVVDSVTVTVELPEGYGNEAAGLSGEIICTVEAVQANGVSVVTDTNDLQAALNKGNLVQLAGDVALSNQLEVTGDVNIDANGHTLTAPAGGTRIINVAGSTEEVTLNIMNATLDASNAERGISFFNNTGSLNVTVENSNVKALYYGINVSSGNSDVTITVNNSTLEGFCAYQSWSANTKATFNNCTLKGVNQWNGGAENRFATVVIYESATNNAATFNDCTVYAIEQGTAKEDFIHDYTDSADIAWNNCTFIKETAGVAEELKTAATEAELAAAVVAGKNVALTSDVALTSWNGNSTVKVDKDVEITLNGFDLDASNSTRRPFELYNGADLTINAGYEKITLGAYGLVYIPDGNSSVSLNGGVYTGAMDNGSFIKPKGTSDVSVTLSAVTLNDTSDDSYLIDGSQYLGNKLDITIDNSIFNVAFGIITHQGKMNIRNCEFNTKLCALEAGTGSELYIENTDITVSGAPFYSPAPAACIAVSDALNKGAGVATVKNCRLTSDCHIFAVYSGASSITATGCTITHTSTAYEAYAIYVLTGATGTITNNGVSVGVDVA